MAHSKFIVIKCPACGEKFEAEREEEATFISCPKCDMQVKISGTHDRKSRSPRRLLPASSIPAKRSQDGVHFSDLASGPVDIEGARRRAQKRMEDEELLIGDEDDEKPKSLSTNKDALASGAGSSKERSGTEGDHGEGAEPSTTGRSKRTGISAIERRAARLEERAAKLEERAAKLAKLKVEREEEEDGKEDIVGPSREKDGEAEAVAVDGTGMAGAVEKDVAAKPKGKGIEKDESGNPVEETGSKEGKSETEAASDEEEGAEYEKVEVRSSGERRRLRKAPKANVPEPKGRPGVPRYVSDLRAEVASEVEKESLSPKQEFDERKVTEGSKWQRHQPNRAEDPDWDADENEEEEVILPSQRRRRMLFVGLAGAVGLFVLVASYQFILAQLGWLEPVSEAREAPLLVMGPEDRLTKGDMFAQVTPVIHSFLGSTSNEEALQYVRFPGKVARFMKRHYLPGDFEPVEIKELGSVDECEIERKGGLFLTVPVTLLDFSSNYMTLELKEEGLKSEWLVDWESWVGYSEMGFAEMRIRQPKQPVLVRCFMIQDFYYNYEFTQDDFISLKLFDHSRQDQLWGYIRKDSKAYQEAAAVFALGHQIGEQRATVKVRFPDKTANPDRDQVEIVDFQSGWIVRH